MSDFKAVWRSRYPTCEPVGYLMRWAKAEHWLRFHSLPESKRYAETDEEKAILLGRQNQLADQVLGSGEPCWLVQTCWIVPAGRIDASGHTDSFRAVRDFHLQPSFEFSEEEDDGAEPGEEAVRWRVCAKLLTWKGGEFDDLLWSIANEVAAPTLWMSAATGAVFAPYDGGVDLFLPSRAEVDILRREHADWLSAHPKGL